MSGATPRPLSPTATDTCPSRTQVSTLKRRGGVTPWSASIAFDRRLTTTCSSLMASPGTGGRLVSSCPPTVISSTPKRYDTRSSAPRTTSLRLTFVTSRSVAYESQQPSQQLRGAPGLTQDLGHLAARLPLEHGVGQPVFGVGGDRHERIVHLVRDAGEQLARRGEAPLLLGPVTQHAGHRVEVLRQATELVGPTNRDADREIAVGDLGEAGLELVQGTPHAPAHHENQEGHQQRTQPDP